MTKLRVESLSDNIFSIVMTLLVFGIKVPKWDPVVSDHDLYLRLADLWPNFMSFVLSFGLLALFWIAHHRLFQHIRNVDTKLVWINNFFLLWIALLPFPTELMGSYPNREPAVMVFGAEMVMALLSLSLLRFYVLKRLSAHFEESLRNGLGASLMRGLIGAVCYIGAIIISVFNEHLTLTIYFFIPLLFFLPYSTTEKVRRPTI